MYFFLTWSPRVSSHISLFLNVLKIVAIRVLPSTIPRSVSLDGNIVGEGEAEGLLPGYTVGSPALSVAVWLKEVKKKKKRLRGNTSTYFYIFPFFSFFVMFCIGFWTYV